MTKALRAEPRVTENCFSIDSFLRKFHKGYTPISPSIPDHSASFCCSSSLLGR